MALNIDIEQLLRMAAATGALSGNGGSYGANQLPGMRGKEASLTLSGLGSLTGCCGLFQDQSNSPLFSLTMQDEAFLAWMGWVANDECRQFVKLLSYTGPSGTASGTQGTGEKAACDDAAGVEFGTCEILLPDKGRLARSGPTRDLTENNRRLWAEQPVYTLDGRQIDDDLTWSTVLAGRVVYDDLKRMVITGNGSSANQFEGLERIVNTGYVNVTNGVRCSAMDSIVVNWANHAMSYKLNGQHALVDYVIAIVRRIRQRITWAGMGRAAVGDMVIMLPTFLRDCLLDAFTCWSVCPGAQYNEANLNTLEARTFRNSLNGGQYGDGQIFVDSQPVPVLTYDWQAVTHNATYFTGDIYVLTRAVNNGAVPVLRGQYIDMSKPANRFGEVSGNGHYKATDGGRFLWYWKTDNECIQPTVVFRPNLWCSAPWAQARIQDVACMGPLNPLSPDPTSSYYAEDYLSTAFCPEDYLTASPPQ